MTTNTNNEDLKSKKTGNAKITASKLDLVKNARNKLATGQYNSLKKELNIVIKANLSVFNSTATKLSSMFLWSESPQGHKFWEEVAEEYNI